MLSFESDYIIGAHEKVLNALLATNNEVMSGYGNDIHTKNAKELIKKGPYSKFVLAHLGANEMVNEVLDILAGEDVYFDTAYVLRTTDEKTFKEIIKRHGSDKILFASDSPWSDIKNDVQIIKSYNLDKETEEKILFKNAKALLSI